MVKDGRWTSGSLGYCMKTDCIHHQDGKCTKACLQYGDYEKANATQLDLFPSEEKK